LRSGICFLLNPIYLSKTPSDLTWCLGRLSPPVSLQSASTWRIILLLNPSRLLYHLKISRAWKVGVHWIIRRCFTNVATGMQITVGRRSTWFIQVLY
jgi:hypothetical protein